MTDWCIKTIFGGPVQSMGISRLQQLYDSLESKQPDRVVLSRYCYPFIPWVGKNYHNYGKPKILFVGQATAGWDDDVSIPHKSLLSEAVSGRVELSILSRITEEYIERKMIPDYGGRRDTGAGRKETQRPFWRMVYQLTLNILDNKHEFSEYHYDMNDSQRCFQAIAWSNVFKVSMNEDIMKEQGNANPDHDMIEFLLHDFNTIEKEIECLEPDIILFSTGWAYDDYLKPTFHQQLAIKSLDTSIDQAEVVKFDGLHTDAIIVRTPHPAGMRIKGWTDYIKHKYLYQCLREAINS